MKMRKSGTLIIIFLIILQLALPARAEEAYISDVVVTNTREDLLIYFSINNCFTEEMKLVIESGLNTSFTFLIRLYEKRDLWWDRTIVDMDVRHSIKYDNLKKIYELRLSEQNDQVIKVKEFEEAKKIMSEVVALKVTSLSNIKKGGHYQLQMMAELDKIRLPLYLHYVFFFLSLWDFETDWYTLDFRY